MKKHLYRYVAPLSALLLLAATPNDFPDMHHLPSHPGLPDPLIRLDGSRVTTAEGWKNSRRAELKALFEHYMYGKSPDTPDAVLGAVQREDRQAIGGKATLREVSIGFGPEGTPEIHLLLVVPNHRKGPVPVFLGLNFHGNHTVLSDPAIALPTAWMPDKALGSQDNHATNAGRGSDVNVWSIEDSIGVMPSAPSIAATSPPITRAGSMGSFRTIPSPDRTIGERSRRGPGVSPEPSISCS